VDGLKYGCNEELEDLFEIFFDMIKGEFFPFHTVKACRNGRGRVPVILNFATGLRWTVSFTPWSFYVRGKNPEPV
jgi:hypothetical protein